MSLKVEVWRNFKNNLHTPEAEHDIDLEIRKYFRELESLGWDVKDYDFFDKDDWKPK